MNLKKKEELAILELFRDRFDGFPKGILKPSESPDFILSLEPRKRIGLELTRLHRQNPGSDLFSYENISACLEQKESKLVLYRKKRLQEYWLILALLDPAAKPRYNMDNKLAVWKFSSSYHRVFMFNVAAGRVLELRKDG